jgi:diaminohydroxyphosphoribosylaminopyrimidine deaminase/5-amino-6-(5-phosphoribosylamino)uracil reductase
VTLGRPMVTLKLARTADGFAAGDEHDQRLAITGEAANLRVQVMRSTHDAIMVGVGTALGDDPLLTVRMPGVEQRVLRAVLDSRLSLPESSRLCATAAQYPTVALTTAAATAEAQAALEARGVEVARLPADAQGHVDLAEALAWLGRSRDIHGDEAARPSGRAGAGRGGPGGAGRPRAIRAGRAGVLPAG